MTNKNLHLNLNQSLPKECFENVQSILNHGNLYRYTYADSQQNCVTDFESKFSELIKIKHSVAFNSCGSAIRTALCGLGIRLKDKVLTNAFTYTAVPSAIVNIGAEPILVECDENYCIDIDDLEIKLQQGAKAFVLSHMRGHICDMEKVSALCKKYNVFLVEDCAHALGAYFDNIHVGTFGEAGCFSFQSHKLLNSGEGGMLCTNSPDLSVYAVLFSGSQEEFWRKHTSIDDYLFKKKEMLIPNGSLRLSALAATVLLPQIDYIPEMSKIFNSNYNKLYNSLAQSDLFSLPKENCNVRRPHDTIQFRLNHREEVYLTNFEANVRGAGISIKRLGVIGNPRYYKSWKYIEGIDDFDLLKTDHHLKSAFDIRLPLWLTHEDIHYISKQLIASANTI